MTSGVTATQPSVTGLQVGTSGWSYASWRPGFYPAGLQPSEFLAYYAERFSTVELNTTGYRIPAEEQFERWADAVPDGFNFAVKLPGRRPGQVGTFVERIRALGDRLGPIRVVLTGERDEGLLELLLGSVEQGLRLAFDLRHESWDGIEPELAAAGAVRVDSLDGEAPFRYVRLREPPYSETDLATWAERLAGFREPVYVYFRHEEEPRATVYAERLLKLSRRGC
jgi:uncharacterized protein YecE (DUF72 family)